jgi:hypothetical protein
MSKGNQHILALLKQTILDAWQKDEFIFYTIIIKLSYITVQWEGKNLKRFALGPVYILDECLVPTDFGGI